MEPLDPAKNDEGSGFTKRRISSILKAPQRSSMKFSDPVQQENVVECAKPVEKRNSRRVSFAPANNVLLFSKDGKNASPAKNPLQELITTTAATKNRVQVAVTEDGIQQITGMETLLNAPLHASQQGQKVNFDTAGDLGEKTVIFSTDDEFMDMTHSHTINIAGDAELLPDISLQNYDPLPSRRVKTEMFTVNNGSMARNISSSVPSLDPEFEKFLASHSKQSGPSSSPVITRTKPASGAPSEEANRSLAQIKTQRANVDKENQAPTSVSAVVEKSLNTSRKIGELSYGSALCPEDDLSMDVTKAKTDSMLGFTDDDPFQCLFPTQEMYSRFDNRVSQTAEKTKQPQRSSKTLASFNPKDMTSLKNPGVHASHQRHKANLDTEDDYKEKTIMFSAGDEFMNMTQSHTVNIASSLLPPPNQNTRGKMDNASSLEERKRETCGAPGSSANALDPGFEDFLSSLSKPGASSGNPAIARTVPSAAASSKETVDTNSSLSQLQSNVGKGSQSLITSRIFEKSINGGTICPENDVSMDMTEAQTGRIIGLSASDDPFQFLFPTQDMYPHCEGLKKQEMTSGQKNSKALRSSNRAGMETALKPSLKTKVQRNPVKFDTEDDCREKPERISAYDACMDVTQSHTVNIVTGFELQSFQNVDVMPICGEKTFRLTTDDTSMDMTKCLTVNIAESVLPVKKQEDETCGLPRNRSSSARGVDPSFNKSLSKPSGPSVNPAVERMTPTAAQHGMGDSSNGRTICPEDDVNMTEAQTGRILGLPDTDDTPRCLFPTQDIYPQSGSLKKAQMTSRQQHNETLGTFRKGMDTSLVQRNQVKFDADDDCREKTVKFTADDACMDMTRSHTINIATDLKLQSHQNLDFSPAFGEKTMRFNITDAAMDVTRSHTVNIATDLKLQPHQDVDILPAGGEKTMRFNTTDAAMDVTRSHTVNIATDLKLQSHQYVDSLPAFGEKTMRFNTTDAAMDVTRSHTVNIATDLKLQSHQYVDSLPAFGEKTMRFNTTDAAMDVTRSHTVNIATDFEPQSHQDVDILPAGGEKTMRFADNDAAMDVTQCLTVNIASNSVSDSLLPRRDSNILFTHKDVDFPLSAKKTHRPRGNQSSSAHALDPGFKNSLSRKSGPWVRAVAPAAPSPQETPDTDGLLDQLKIQKPDVDTEKVALPFVSAVLEKSVNKTMTEGPEHDVSMNMTEAQTGGILEQTYTGEPPQCLSSTQDFNPDHLKKTEATPQQRNEALGSSNPGRVEIPNLPDSPDSNETGTSKEPKSKNLTCSLSQKMVNSPSAVDHDVDTAPSRKSRRMSLADIKSKVRRLSHMVSTAPDTIAMDSHTAPLPHLERDMDKTSNDKTKSLPVTEPQLEMGLVNTEENTQAQCVLQGEQPSATTTPFNLKTKQLMSRLSVGIFKAKLPQKRKPDDPKKGNSVDKHQRTVAVNVTNQLSNFVDDMSDIYNEELDSYEDMSETLDIMSPQNATEKVSASQEFDMDELLEKDVSEKDFISPVSGKKRPVPADENNVEDEKRLKVSTDVEMGFQPHVVECDSNATTVPSMTTQTTDYSNSSHTASIRCEATLESTYKQSLFESQLEDYANDVQRKLDDDTITLLEFFQLFNIDFVIHNPRQSILPGRLLSDTDRTPMDLLKDRHINRPKQMVYETDVLNLTEMVEGLKERMRDLDKPLKIVNRPLWEEVRNYSEKELKSFGAKLKERHNLFRKLSKVQSHEMKEVLYSNLVQANLKEQQRPRGMIEEADGMIKSLDDCIRELETELIAVEEKGFEDQPSLKSRQEEIQKVTEALEDNNRQISELEMQKKQTSNKLSRLKVETSNLESHVTALHMVNEWKFGEKKDNCSVYTFLYETLILQLVYEKSNGNDAANRSERKISHITLSLQLDDEKSLGNARLVHKLLSQYIEGETDWVEKYPTSRHVPQLLHDVSLVVSRCRLLGEELRRLKTWGSVRLNILNMSCVDTQVHFVFSSLKTFSQFEVIFSVSLIGQPYALQLQSFKNMIGNTTIQQIEEIVSSFSPSKNLLTKIVKKINENLLY
ncbi:kinetochore scaffold 1 isoform X4 [Sander lucioperca]|uniref:kinetochore scaffold 1 isoform X4 n=1 Tax=Sander lucioperca TaxID=283035 RepID=UPI001653A397|nr:kinetochore scaffold 1 isoform X4 [Sander lucioperca]